MEIFKRWFGNKIEVNSIDDILKPADKDFFQRDLLETILFGSVSQSQARELYLQGWLKDQALAKHPIFKQFVSEAVDLAFEEAFSNQEKWQTQTDSDRLTKSFLELEKRDLLAEEFWGQNQSQGGFLAAEEIEARALNGRRPIGYAFYHEQDPRVAIELNHLFISFGADLPDGKTSADPQRDIQIGELVAKTLREFGFEIDWNGTADTRICIKNFKWQRRIPRNL